MTRTIAFAVSLAVFALGGFWLGGKREQPTAVMFAVAAKKPLHCQQNDCETQVTVLWDCATACEIAVRDDVMIVKKGKKITWKITHPDYQFQSGGIAFADANAPQCSFDSTKPKEYECKASAGSPDYTAFKYKITLTPTVATNPAPPPLDPYVVNN